MPCSTAREIATRPPYRSTSANGVVLQERDRRRTGVQVGRVHQDQGVLPRPGQRTRHQRVGPVATRHERDVGRTRDVDHRLGDEPRGRVAGAARDLTDVGDEVTDLGPHRRVHGHRTTDDGGLPEAVERLGRGRRQPVGLDQQDRGAVERRQAGHRDGVGPAAVRVGVVALDHEGLHRVTGHASQCVLDRHGRLVPVVAGEARGVRDDVGHRLFHAVRQGGRAAEDERRARVQSHDLGRRRRVEAVAAGQQDRATERGRQRSAGQRVRVGVLARDQHGRGTVGVVRHRGLDRRQDAGVARDPVGGGLVDGHGQDAVEAVSAVRVARPVGDVVVTGQVHLGLVDELGPVHRLGTLGQPQRGDACCAGVVGQDVDAERLVLVGRRGVVDHGQDRLGRRGVEADDAPVRSGRHRGHVDHARRRWGRRPCLPAWGRRRRAAHGWSCRRRP